MQAEQVPLAEAVQGYLSSRPRWVRWREWIEGRRYVLAKFPDRPKPVVIVAHSWRDAARAREIVLAVEQVWGTTPSRCREAFEEILARAPALIVVQLRRSNLCGCLGHRHVLVKEAPFAEPHEGLGGGHAGEMDIAFERVEGWLALPLMDTALDTQFMAGSRLQEFQVLRLRLRLLSILLHETHHMVFSQDPEEAVRERSLAFYREALADYVVNARATMSLTIDRSFSRFGRD
jgi:hypothetical protein